MRVVTVATVLGYRSVLPKIRAAFLRVAIEAGLIERHLANCHSLVAPCVLWQPLQSILP